MFPISQILEEYEIGIRTDIRDELKPVFSDICYFLDSRESGKKNINAFNNTEKSKFIYKTILKSVEEKLDLGLIVFQKNSLITQFIRDYIMQDKKKDVFSQMNVCSKDELDNEDEDIEFTTESHMITSFLYNMTGSNIICCTYKSLDSVVDSMPSGLKVDVLQFNGLPPISSPLQAEHIYGKTFYNLGLFYNVFND